MDINWFNVGLYGLALMGAGASALIAWKAGGYVVSQVRAAWPKAKADLDALVHARLEAVEDDIARLKGRVAGLDTSFKDGLAKQAQSIEARLAALEKPDAPAAPQPTS